MNPDNKLLRIITIPVILLLALSTIILAVYAGCTAVVKNSIRANLQPMIDELCTEYGVESVNVQICLFTKNNINPSKPDFHVFIRANYDDLNKLTSDERFDILDKDITTVEMFDVDEFVYGETKICYTKHVEDSKYNNYPVFMTLSDGTTSYSITEKLYCNKIDLYQFATKSTANTATIVSAIITAVLFVLLFVIAFANLRSVPEENKKHVTKYKAILAAVGVILPVVVVATLIINSGDGSSAAYKEAVRLQKSGNIEESYAIFRTLGDYKNSEDYRNKIDYARATDCMNAGNDIDAYTYLLRLDDYKDSAELRTQLESGNSYLQFMTATPGSIVTLGEYEQDNNKANGNEPIEWIVIHSAPGKVLLLSRYVLDVNMFNILNQQYSDLDVWLKGEFHDSAFASVPEGIVSRTGFLQYADKRDYIIPEDVLKTQYTPYATEQNSLKNSSDKKLMWWVEADSLEDTDATIFGSCIDAEGKNNSCPVFDYNGVRPAIWLFADEDDLRKEPEYNGKAASSRDNEAPVVSGDKCANCKGTGRVKFYYGSSDLEAILDGHDPYTIRTCPSCGGTGR